MYFEIHQIRTHKYINNKIWRTECAILFWNDYVSVVIKSIVFIRDITLTMVVTNQ